jgi:hypothetical protein
MSDVDYFAMSRQFGGTMQPIKQPTFGPFGTLQTVVEVAKARFGEKAPRPRFTTRQDKLIARSFEKTRDGLPPDALLWDSNLLKRFVNACKDYDLSFSPPSLLRRLLCILKNPKKYSSLGIVLRPTTKKETYPSVLAEHAPVVEFSLVRLRYRYGASIDEILIDPVMGEEFEKMANEFLPGLSSIVLRQTALTLRKTRFLPKGRQRELTRLRASRLESQWSPFQSLAAVDISAIPKTPGIVEVREARRELYVSRNDDLHGVMRILAERQAISIMGSPFWHPNSNEIEARFIPETSTNPAMLEQWELKLLAEQKPIFNWPIKRAKAA